MAAAAHIYEIFIRTTPERVWEALIDPEYTRQYFHGTRFESTFERGSGYRNVLGDGTAAVDGVIEEFDPPHRLVMTWHVLDDPEMAAEPPSRVEWQLSPATDDGSVTRVTLRHGDLALSPRTWAHVRLGWVAIIDGLKTLLETGEPLGDIDTAGDGPALTASDVDAQWHRTQAIAANNSVWEILEDQSDTSDGGDELLHRAHAAAYHWARAADSGPVNQARASWMLSRCYVVLGHGALALHHADTCSRICATSDLVDFDLAYAHEARARALACLGQLDEARIEHRRASTVEIADPEDGSIFASDLAAEPWFGLLA